MVDDVQLKEWKDYLDEIYNWINSRHQQLTNGEITQEDYNNDYLHYQKEMDRVNGVIEHSKMKNTQPTESPKVDESNKKGSTINPEMIESFFFGDKTKPHTPQITSKETDSPRPISPVQPIKQVARPKMPVNTNDRSVVVDNIAKQSISPNITTNTFSQPSQESSDSIEVNVVLLGNSSVGRTSIRRAILGKNFIPQHLSTVGASIEKKIIYLNDKAIEYTLMDLGGQDFYASVRANFYRNATAAIVVFDLNSVVSFNHVDKWLRELYSNTKQKAIPFVLVGNKLDLKREVKAADAERLAQNLSTQTKPHGFIIPYIEVSAKTGENINLIFEILGRQLLQLRTLGKL